MNAEPSLSDPAEAQTLVGSAALAPWTQAQAIALCREIEAICPEFGCHVALTGGCLYKDGERKDLDVLFYRIRQTPHIDHEGLFAALANIGVDRTRGFGWCVKATYDGRGIDCFFPEGDGDYDPLPADWLDRPFTEKFDDEVVF